MFLSHQFVISLKLSSVLKLALSHSDSNRKGPSRIRQLVPIMKTVSIIQNLLVVTYDKMVEDSEVGILENST